MTDSTNTPIEADNIPDNLNDFRELLYKGKTPDAVVDTETGDEVDTSANEDEAQAELPLDTAEASPKEEPVVEEKPKKQTLQERIDEITAKRREAERLADEKARENAALLERIKQLEAGTTETAAKPQEKTETTNGMPDPEALNADGTEKYPLGEFDKEYVKDLTKWQFEQLIAEQRATQEKTAEEKAREDAAQTLVNEWTQKLNEARETKYPDFEEKAATIQIEFSDLDPNYGDYLASTIMGLENGTDVLYYLASNLDEAKAIAKSGSVAATVALGRLSARLESPATTTTENPKVKTTKAPEPPPQLNKGASTAEIIRADTDDLEAFKRLLWPNQKRK